MDAGRLVAALTIMVLLHAEALPQSMPVPIEVQYPLLMKVLSADRNFSARSGSEIVIGVLYQENVRESSRAAQALRDWARQNPSTPVSGSTVRLVMVPVEAVSGLELSLERDSVDLCYITPLRAASLDSLLSVTRHVGVATCTGVPEYVERGVAIGIGVKADHPQILVNMASARVEKIDLGSQVLQLARVYDKD